MKGRVTVASAPSSTARPVRSSAPAESESPDDHGSPPPAVTASSLIPNAPPYRPYDTTALGAFSGTTHDIELVMPEEMMTVAPGFLQQVWTFGGTVSGPVIRVKVGDTVRVHLKNPAANQLAHSIDFHSSQGAWNDEMRSIARGEELRFEWTAESAGVWMYHCGIAPALHHIANGMYGMVIVESREGSPPVHAGFALLQSEWYLGPLAVAGSLFFSDIARFMVPRARAHSGARLCAEGRT